MKKTFNKSTSVATGKKARSVRLVGRTWSCCVRQHAPHEGPHNIYLDAKQVGCYIGNADHLKALIHDANWTTNYHYEQDKQ